MGYGGGDEFFNNFKRGPIVNILKVADSGIILTSLVNSPKKGILKNLVGRPVGRVGCGSRANGAPCPTPIDVVSLGDQERSRSSVHSVRGRPGGGSESREGSDHTPDLGACDRQGNPGLVGPYSWGSDHRSRVGALGGLVGPGGWQREQVQPLGSVHKTECADGQTNGLRVRQ